MSPSPSRGRRIRGKTCFDFIPVPSSRDECTAVAAAVATVVRTVRPGQSPGTARIQGLPVLVHNAADGELVPPGRALAVQVGEEVVLWCDPGYGEKIVGDWTTDGECLVAQRDTVYARQASVVTRQEKPAVWRNL